LQIPKPSSSSLLDAIQRQSVKLKPVTNLKKELQAETQNSSNALKSRLMLRRKAFKDNSNNTSNTNNNWNG